MPNNTMLREPEVIPPAAPRETPPREKNTWSALQAKQKPDEKRLMGRHCAAHDFLVSPGNNPELDTRDRVASILVNNGTTPELAVRECLEWIVPNHETRGPFDLTWYTTSTLIPSTLKEYRDKHPSLASSMNLFLLPGRVDQERESVCGPEPVEFVKSIQRGFRYAFLSAHSFDMTTGTAHFQFSDEVALQKACATRYAAHKFLFVDSRKFKKEGDIGYTIGEILEHARAATIYTVTSDPAADSLLRQQFQRLCDRIFRDPDTDTTDVEVASRKRELRLIIVGRDQAATDRGNSREALLRADPAPVQ